MKTEIRLIAETVLPRLSTGDLDLGKLPERLDDAALAEVQAIASAPLPELPKCDARTFGQVLRMMLAALPRRQADDISGELFVAAYERQLGHLSHPQAEYLLDRALNKCRWFPTIAECHELLSDWRRRDDAVIRQNRARSLAEAEYRARRLDERGWEQARSMLMTQQQVDAMPAELQRIGLKCGALYQDETGKIRPEREIEMPDGF